MKLYFENAITTATTLMILALLGFTLDQRMHIETCCLPIIQNY